MHLQAQKIILGLGRDPPDKKKKKTSQQFDTKIRTAENHEIQKVFKAEQEYQV